MNINKRRCLYGCLAALFASAAPVTAATDCADETVFNWAEKQFPAYFPVHDTTKTWEVFQYRYYPETSVYAGIRNDQQVYVLGGAFGNELFYIDTLKQLVTVARRDNVDALAADCTVNFTAVTLPAAASGSTPPTGTYLGLTPVLQVVDEKTVMGVKNTAFNDGGSLLRSADSGVNWEQVQTNVAPIQAIDFADTLTGYAVGSRSAFGVSQYLGKTVDGGKTWEDITQRLGQVNEVVAGIPRYTLILKVITPNPQVLYIAGRHTVYASVDGGEQWLLAGGAKSRDETTKTGLYAHTLAKVDGIAYIAGYDTFDSVDSTINAAQEWTSLTAPWNHNAGMPLVSITFRDVNSGWAMVEDTALNQLSLYATVDRGKQWVKVLTSDKNDQNSLFPRSGNLQYFSGILFGTAQFPYSLNGRNYVVSSVDGGKTWQKNAWNGGGWPLVYKVVNQELRAYANVNNDYNLRAYGVF